MLSQTHFYNQTIKRTVALFGTLFNNLTIARTADVGGVMSTTGAMSNVERVPIAYGPKQKFIARISEQPTLDGPKVAIKVPRMSFEMTSIAYDSAVHLNRMNRTLVPIAGDTLHVTPVLQCSPYRIGMQLNIYGRNQDDVLQCLEQILPTFNPEYTVVVKDGDASGVNSNVPITLNSISMSDDYEGDIAARRTIIYTLDFDIRVRFLGPVNASQGLIRFVEAGLVPHTTPLSAEIAPVRATYASGTGSSLVLTSASGIIAIGALVSGTNIPANTYVTATNGTSTVTLSGPASGTGSGILTFTPVNPPAEYVHVTVSHSGSTRLNTPSAPFPILTSVDTFGFDSGFALLGLT